VGRSDGKTEKATPHRRLEARREGRSARSQEIAVAASLGGALIAMRTLLPGGAQVLRDETVGILAHLPSQAVPLGQLTDSGVRIAAALVAPFLAVGVAAALVAGVAQGGFRVSLKSAKPKLSNLSPRRGLERLKPATAAWGLGKELVKLTLLTALLWGPLVAFTRELGGGLGHGLSTTVDQAGDVLTRAAGLAIVIAGADYAYQRRSFSKSLRMSKEEVKQESKNSEGDPLIKGQRRRRAMEMSRKRMLSNVAGADIVVTNPTHFAVALRYGDGDAAPRVVAKGTQKMAARIRREAYRHGVPVTEDRPLARALYRRCTVGQYVPATLYEAVAIVLALAYRRLGRRVA